jgi:hypothetical protein
VRGHLRIDLSLVEGEAPSIAWRSVDAKGHALLDVCGIELTKPCTKEVVARLMGSTRISGDVRCNPPRPIFAEQLGGRASALTVFLTKPRPRLGHIGKEYAARLRLFRGGWQWQDQLQYRFS